MEGTGGVSGDRQPGSRPAARQPELAGYEIGEVVGRGAFGVVYRAREVAFNRTVAIKLLTVPIDEEGQARFERERQSMGAVSGHPNIVTVYASGFDEWERPYLVMDFMEGGSLAGLVEREGALAWEQAVDIGVKLAGALETAHRAGILHRDVKPENVMISAYGDPKLGDFGISRIHGSYQTRSGMVTATPLYAAPEILNGERASAASDVYSLAATLFPLITGAPAFHKDTDEAAFALYYRVSTEPVPDLRPHGVPGEICAVIERAMAKDPAQRQASAGEFGEDLRQAQLRLGLAATEMRVTLDRNATVTGQPAASLVTPKTPSGGAGGSGGSGPLPAPVVAGGRGIGRGRIAALAAVVLLLVAGGVVAVASRGGGDRVLTATDSRGGAPPPEETTTTPPPEETTTTAAPEVLAAEPVTLPPTTQRAATPAPARPPSTATTTTARPNRAPYHNPAYPNPGSFSLTGSFQWWDIWLKPDAFLDADGDGWAFYGVTNGSYGSTQFVACGQDTVHGCIRYTPYESAGSGSYYDTVTYQAWDPAGSRTPSEVVTLTLCVRC